MEHGYVVGELAKRSVDEHVDTLGNLVSQMGEEDEGFKEVEKAHSLFKYARYLEDTGRVRESEDFFMNGCKWLGYVDHVFQKNN